MTSSQRRHIRFLLKSTHPLHVRSTENSMCTRPIENPIPVKQRHSNATEQQSIHRNSGNSRPCCARPLFSHYCPRGKPTGKICRLHQWRNVMSSLKMFLAALPWSLRPHQLRPPQISSFRTTSCPTKTEYRRNGDHQILSPTGV